MEKNKIIFKKAISEKSGKAYNCIVVDMGYREVTLSRTNTDRNYASRRQNYRN